MKIEQRERGAPRQESAPPTSSTQITASRRQTADVSQGTAVRRARVAEATVYATAYAPCQGRALWSYAASCPGGHGIHMHRAGPPRSDGYLRTAPCGREYRVLARTVVPARFSGVAAEQTPLPPTPRCALESEHYGAELTPGATAARRTSRLRSLNPWRKPGLYADSSVEVTG